ncbi:MAG: hypothetical protein HFG66_13755 [Hungatella sp.]|nr:hypothetical protein [Hungatella sp.]
MGIIKEFKCPSCHKTWRISVGHGRAHSTLKRVLGAFPPDIRKKIGEDAQKDPDPLFLFNYRASLCQQCQDILEVPVLDFIEPRQSYISPCPKCGGRTDIVEDERSVSCPRCRQAVLTVQETGHWD